MWETSFWLQAQEAEAAAVLFGLKLAYEAGFRLMDVETDFLNLAHML